MVTALQPSDQRRAALSAGLLASNHDGEVVAAARALCGLLRKGNLDPATVVSAGLTAVISPAVPVVPRASAAGAWSDISSWRGGSLRPLGQRARMARYSPHINDWERQFLNDMMDLRRFTERQETTLKAILRKSEGPGQ